MAYILILEHTPVLPDQIAAANTWTRTSNFQFLEFSANLKDKWAGAQYLQDCMCAQRRFAQADQSLRCLPTDALDP